MLCKFEGKVNCLKSSSKCPSENIYVHSKVCKHSLTSPQIESLQIAVQFSATTKIARWTFAFELKWKPARIRRRAAGAFVVPFRSQLLRISSDGEKRNATPPVERAEADFSQETRQAQKTLRHNALERKHCWSLTIGTGQRRKIKPAAHILTSSSSARLAWPRAQECTLVTELLTSPISFLPLFAVDDWFLRCDGSNFSYHACIGQ